MTLDYAPTEAMWEARIAATNADATLTKLRSNLNQIAAYGRSELVSINAVIDEINDAIRNISVTTAIIASLQGGTYAN